MCNLEHTENTIEAIIKNLVSPPYVKLYFTYTVLLTAMTRDQKGTTSFLFSEQEMKWEPRDMAGSISFYLKLF